ncbi:hypothetical protein ACWGST_16375 [Agromyces sp. NPDC055520]
MDRSVGRIWPFFAALCVGLFIVAFVPALSTWLPTALGLMAP